MKVLAGVTSYLYSSMSHQTWNSHCYTKISSWRAFWRHIAEKPSWRGLVGVHRDAILTFQQELAKTIVTAVSSLNMWPDTSKSVVCCKNNILSSFLNRTYNTGQQNWNFFCYKKRSKCSLYRTFHAEFRSVFRISPSRKVSKILLNQILYKNRI